MNAIIEAARRMTGLEQLRAVMGEGGERASIGRTLDFWPVEIEEGHVVFEGRPGTGHLNPLRAVHGGYAATLLDSCMGCAVHTMLPAGKTFTTLELKVNYIRSLKPDSGIVRAVGDIIHAGRTTATAEGRLFDPQGRLVAHGTTTCIVMDI